MKEIDELIFNECKKTFMEQMKVHKRETAFAAILAYYFKPHEDHGLGNLFLNAFFNTKSYSWDIPNRKWHKESHKVTFPTTSEEIKVNLEVPTKRKNRIDLLISSKEFVICIEFKIDHKLNNDLLDYQNEIENREEFSQHTKYYFVLCPKELLPEGEAKKYFESKIDFKLIVLSHFFEEIEKLFYKQKEHFVGNTKLQFYEDLVQTVKNRRVRSQRFITLDEIQVELSKEFIESKFHNNNQGGFIEIKSSKYTSKLRVNQNGWQFEKWIDNKKDYTLEFNNKSDLDTTEKVANTFIEFSNINIISS